MGYEVISIKVDPVTKKEARRIADKIGLSLSAVLKGFLKQFIRTKTITFSVGEDEIPSERLIKAIKRAEKNLKEGKHSPIFRTGEEAVAWLEKQGL
ncbi:type II toxin-antitoxin system RelB/DinJ family antitoxin [Candidatus Daviesbacteria bacterium]|nr:type II toxin-antitoxin system RelB/DinJ family antitoxin [Candidatus Daviesbacteria bacterium]